MDTNEREITSYKDEIKMINDTLSGFEPSLFLTLKDERPKGMGILDFRGSEPQHYQSREKITRVVMDLLRRVLGLRSQHFSWIAWHEFGNKAAGKPLRNGGHCHVACRVPDYITGDDARVALEELQVLLKGGKTATGKKHRRAGMMSWLSFCFTRGNDGETVKVASHEAVAIYGGKFEGLFENGDPPFKEPFSSDWKVISRICAAYAASDSAISSGRI